MPQRKFKIRKGDTVQVMVGKSTGLRGVIKCVLRGERKVIVDGVNAVVRNIKPSYKYPQGSYKKEMPIDISNVSLIDPSNDKPGKVGFRFNDDGSKVRYFRKSGVVI
jgi:large subunit ribosomal protein L24